MAEDYFSRLVKSDTATASSPSGGHTVRRGLLISGVSIITFLLGAWAAISHSDEWFWCGNGGGGFGSSPCEEGFVGVAGLVIVLVSTITLLLGIVIAIFGALVASGDPDAAALSREDLMSGSRSIRDR